jgi:hypothetical protein
VKFLADEGFPHSAVEMLRKLGWDIREVVIDVPHLRGCDDVKEVLRYAKRTQRVLLSSDMFSDRATRTSMWADVRKTKRGRVISISGGPQKIVTQIVGKLLFHQDQWETFLNSGHGIVQIGDLKADQLRKWRPDELNVMSTVKVKQGEAYVNRPRQLPLPKPKKPAAARASAPLEGLL